MKKALISSALLLATLPSIANAEERWPRWYLGLAGGYNYTGDVEFSGTTGNGDLPTDGGIYGAVALGYMPSGGGNVLIDNSRIELELAYRENDVDNSNSDVSIGSLAANYFYDIDMGGDIKPYVGAGIGVAEVNLSGTNQTSVESDDVAAIYQLMAGLTYTPEELHRTEVYAGYKYFDGFSDAKISDGSGTTELDFGAHTVEAGVRLRF